MAQFRFTSIYIGSNKVADIEQVKLSFMSNGEQLVSVDAVAESTGVVTSDATLDTVMPIGGMAVDIVQMVLDQLAVSLGGEFNGNFYTCPGKFIKADVSSVVKSGVTKGNFQFRGAKPQKVSLGF